MPAPYPSAPLRRTWRLRPRRLLVLLAAVAGLAALIFLAQWFQGGRGAGRLLREAEKLAEVKEKPRLELALTFLRDYLAANPDDPEALALRSRILMDTATVPAQFQEMVRNDEALLRVDPLPDGARAQDARRRLIQAHLILSEGRGVADQTYQVADVLAQALESRQARPAPADLRQHALVIEKLTQGSPEGLERAAKLYEKALAIAPGDVLSAERLTRLLYKGIKDRDRGMKVVDRLLAANSSPQALLAAAVLREEAAAERLGEGAADEARDLREQAARDLDRAITAAPRDTLIRVVAAELALAKGRPDLARLQLDAVPETGRDNLRYRTARGVVDLQQDRPDEAIDQWSRGLFLTGGSNLDLSSRLAYVMLRLGRVKDAEPLIDQAQRLRGRHHSADPLPPGPAAQNPGQAQGGHRPSWKQGRLKVTPDIAPIYYELMGQCRHGRGGRRRGPARLPQGPGPPTPRRSIPRLHEGAGSSGPTTRKRPPPRRSAPA